MGLQFNSNAFTIVSQTTGAEGNVSNILLPGGLYSYWSSLGVLYPDTTDTQRVDIWIDSLVNPTIEDIRLERDRVLMDVLDCLSGIEDNPENTSLRIFPNPVTTEVHFTLENQYFSAAVIQVANSTGQQVFNLTLSPSAANEFSFDVTDLAPGVYFLQILLGQKMIRFKSSLSIKHEHPLNSLRSLYPFSRICFFLVSFLYGGELTGQPPTISYSVAKSEINSERTKLSHSQFNPDSVSRILTTYLVDKLIPYWLGTPWSFEGHPSVPGTGEIACGYFVSTTLQDVGFNMNRYKFAQQLPIHEAKTLSLGITLLEINNNTTGERINVLRESLKKGIYFIGFDQSHVGYIQKKKDELFVIIPIISMQKAS